ncbi:Hypothetical protein SMAX5B_003883 [Scophthalmus maximus]|uniref:Uncharacterized protein n=1 Tax=Scophthalmus maximus TaxID=52904 RepID=A0A2U9AV66_SCOMX|nr:Hypothetical protein SMAX5B_003883 [Scophthalmus maximus]
MTRKSDRSLITLKTPSHSHISSQRCQRLVTMTTLVRRRLLLCENLHNANSSQGYFRVNTLPQRRRGHEEVAN